MPLCRVHRVRLGGLLWDDRDGAAWARGGTEGTAHAQLLAIRASREVVDATDARPVNRPLLGVLDRRGLTQRVLQRCGEAASDSPDILQDTHQCNVLCPSPSESAGLLPQEGLERAHQEGHAQCRRQ